MGNKQFLYKIVCSRDKRYDGRFYCGVRTTGIYCRPICPARPKLENITFYRSGIEAENAGFRACLRCRPDLAPHSVQWSGTGAVVGRALAMIERGDADDISLEHLADKLGLSDRHLRRLFAEHVGASPIEVANSKRLHLANQLLRNANLSVTEVALASGFQSIRRFNESFKAKFKIAPSQLRRSSELLPGSHSGFICVDLPVIAPFDWDHIFAFLNHHGAAGVEGFSEGKYRRNFIMQDTVGAVEVGYDRAKEQLSAKVLLSNISQLRVVIERVRDLFDARLNPHAHVGDFRPNDPVATCYLNELGLRIPGAWDPFETAVGVVLGQLVSVEQAKTKVARLVEQFGTRVKHPMFNECTHLFPTAQVLANAEFKQIGMTKVREHALKELARQVLEKRIELSRNTNIKQTKDRLLAIKGIGSWTVEMIAMRCLGDTNAFPQTDLIVKRALEHHRQNKGDWSPWNAYIALALWKRYAVTLSKKQRIVTSGKK